MILDLLTETVYQRVIAGTLVIGCTCGVLGTFTYLRRQSLIADVIGHSSMLGVTLAFLVSVTLLGIDGRTILVIVLVSAIVGVLSALLTSRIADTSRVGPDAAMAVVLAVTFGGGMALLAEINSRSFPSSRAGLKDYLFGNASTVTWSDIRVSAAFAGAALHFLGRVVGHVGHALDGVTHMVQRSAHFGAVGQRVAVQQIGDVGF